MRLPPKVFLKSRGRVSVLEGFFTASSKTLTVGGCAVFFLTARTAVGRPVGLLNASFVEGGVGVRVFADVVGSLRRCGRSIRFGGQMAKYYSIRIFYIMFKDR